MILVRRLLSLRARHVTRRRPRGLGRPRAPRAAAAPPHAMYAPVVARFTTYQVKADEVCAAYMRAVTELPAWAEWTAAALKETWVLPEDEPDWPTVRRM